ncbi:MAG: nucleotidyltransferase domain-containing protein [Cyanobacteria bacterium]|nr:nucleotidyltransferase domain-containing protein [Cyanobacteriota bacterium]
MGLPDATLTAIRQVLASHPEVEAAILYGSRALGRHRPASDIDLTLIGPAISAASLARIDADLDDLLLPWMIDLSCQASIDHPALLAHIERAGFELYRRRDAPGLPASPAMSDERRGDG